MKYAIIAAGEGSRLAREGIWEPKPLVEVGGERLIDRLFRIFTDNNADEIVVICNDLTALVSQHLEKIQRRGLNGLRVPLRFIVRTTPSSMHSFFELSGFLGNAPFILTTVDTVFREEEFATYVAAFEQTLADGKDGLMGVTGFIDDEKPLYVATDEALNVTGFYDDKVRNCCYVSGGIYGLGPDAVETLQRCIANGESRMRNFQRGLIRDGRRLRAYPFSKVLDIDHADDISKAERFLIEL